jgi:hypothetical protein
VSFARVIVGDKAGSQLAELSADIGPISWRLNKVGKVTFSLAVTDPKATQDNLKYGNKLLIQFSNGLPNWGGVIDPPRKWDGSRISVTAYTAAYLFKYRITGKNKTFSGATVGAIFQALINETNADEDTGVQIGSIYAGGTGHGPEYHYKNLLDIFQKSLAAGMSTSDFDFVPTLVNGKIVFTANFYESKGIDKTNFALVDGANITKLRLIEQGPIVNDWDLAGKGTGWGAERITASDQNIESISSYGLRQGSKVYSDVSIQGTLDDHAANLLDEFETPFNIFEIEAADKKPGKFADYDLGDTITLMAPDYGFGGIKTTVRILARSFDPDSGLCDLVVQEVQNG